MPACTPADVGVAASQNLDWHTNERTHARKHTHAQAHINARMNILILARSYKGREEERTCVMNLAHPPQVGSVQKPNIVCGHHPDTPPELAFVPALLRRAANDHGFATCQCELVRFRGGIVEKRLSN